MQQPKTIEIIGNIWSDGYSAAHETGAAQLPERKRDDVAKSHKALADLLLGLPSLQVKKSDGGYIAPIENRKAIQIREELAEALGMEA